MMRNRILLPVAVSLTLLTGLAATGWWLFRDPAGELTLSVPGLDHTGAEKRLVKQDVKIGETFTVYGSSPEIAGPGWPGFRGPERENISRENIPLISKWGDWKSRIRWRLKLGEGHAAPAVYGGRVYILDYDEAKKSDALRCFSLSDGRELWRREYRVHLKRNHGLSRTIPAVNEKYAVSIGPKGQVMCVDRVTGEMKWGLDMEKEYGAEIPFWYTGQCPLLCGDTVVLAPGGRVLLTGIDCATGKMLWETPNPKKWKMSHASVMRGVISGQPTFVYFAIGGVCGVAATGPETGKILWETEEFSPAVVAPSPLLLDKGRILLTAGYGAGTAMIRVQRKTAGWSVAIEQQFRPNEGIASEQQTPVFHNGYIYAVLPKDAGGERNQFIAVTPDNCRKTVFSSGKEERFGLGPYLLADGKFFILNDDGDMTIARVENNRFIRLDIARILEGQDAWGPLALSGGLLLARDSRELICIDIREL